MNSELIMNLVIIFGVLGFLVFCYNIYQLVKNIDNNVKNFMKANDTNIKNIWKKLEEIDHRSRNLGISVGDIRKRQVNQINEEQDEDKKAKLLDVD